MNIISWISVTGIALSVAAMIIVLSAINGLEGLVNEVFSQFDPDIKITAKEGKTFDSSAFPREEIKKIKGVAYYSDVVEEICIVKHGEKWIHATLKGVENDFIETSHLKRFVKYGEPVLRDEYDDFCIIGLGIASKLELQLSIHPGEYARTTLYLPVRNRKIKINNNPFNDSTVYVSGLFEVNPEYDIKYIITTKEIASTLLEYKNDISAVEIGLEKDVDENTLREEIQKVAGNNFEVKTRFQQNEILYSVSQSEKWFTFAMLSFILLLTSFNIVASLTLLVIDKKKDIYTLRSLGADNSLIRRIFFTEGMFINLTGASLGIILGLLVCLAQNYFHLVPMNGTVIDHYPVALKIIDFILAFSITLLIGAICSWVPVRYLARKHL